MAYDGLGLFLVNSAGGGQGQTWVYEGVDTGATVIGAGFISDALSRGMNVGDFLIVKEFTSAAKTALTALTTHAITAVAASGATAGAALSGSGSNFLGSGTATPDANYDVVDGNLVGSIYVETDQIPKEPYVCTSNGTGAAVWQSMANEAVLSIASPVLTSAAQTLRLVAPFTGRVVGFRGVVTTVATGASDKLLRLVISGNTVTSGSLTLGHGNAAGTRYAATPTTDNACVAGNQITLQFGAQKTATGVFNFYVMCRRMIG